MALTPGMRLGAYEVTAKLGEGGMGEVYRIFGGGVDIQLGRQSDVTADGRFLINTLSNEATAPITLLQNWNPAAKR